MNADPAVQLRLLDLQAADTALNQFAHRRKSLPELAAIAGKDAARLEAGGLPPRELSGLEHEIATLARRQSTLEDELLDVMERGETAADELRVAQEARDEVLDEQRGLEVKRDEAFTEIDAAIAAKEPQRSAIADELPADLLALYERSRAQSGNGAAMLKQRRCEACRIELSGSEISAVRKAAPDAVVRCENCRAILVRTPESGL